MLNPRWHKVLGDLAENKTRTGLVVMALAVGVFTFGLVGNAQYIIDHEIQAGLAASNPADIILSLSPFDEDLIHAVEAMPEVAAAEGRAAVDASLMVGDDRWISLRFVALEHPGQEQIGQLSLIEGAFPTSPRTIVLERSIGMVTDFAPGDVARIELADGRIETLSVSGVVYDLTAGPAGYTQTATGYVSVEALQGLTGDRHYNQLYVSLAEETIDKEDQAARLTDWIERQGYVVFSAVPEVKPFAASNAEVISLTLSSVGAFAVFLSGFLITNTISAILMRQTRQIGMMKAIGASSGDVVELYLATVLGYGLLAFLVAVPLAIVGSWGLVIWFGGVSNLTIARLDVSPAVIAIQGALALALPAVTSLVPVLRGARVTVHDALADYGITAPQRSGRLSRLSERSLGLPRPLMLSFRNTMRRTGRLILTLLALMVAGAMFIGIVSLRGSMIAQALRMADLFRFDFAIALGEPAPAARLERKAMQVSGVSDVETWMLSVGQFYDGAGKPLGEVSVYAVPPGTAFVRPTLVEGRWLRPGDDRVVVVSGAALPSVGYLHAGDSIDLKVNGRRNTWQVVGVTIVAGNDQFSRGAVYVPIDTFGRLNGTLGRANYVAAATSTRDTDMQSQIMQTAADELRNGGVPVGAVFNGAQMRTLYVFVVKVMIALMMSMAVLLGVIGGLSLAGMMSLNVIERTREIGVMRAIGARNRDVWGIVITEGVAIGITGALLGAVAAIPFGSLLATGIGMALTGGEPIPFQYSLVGALLWLAISAILAALSSLQPAYAASRVAVRDALAYEG
ncbi:MAG: ABC transporter permease [Anaerolineae bacterium]|nr:ABC transporter permease [Anaerolineae bacterium]